MLAIVLVCGPVLAILISGLVADRRFLADLRRLQSTRESPPVPVAAPTGRVPGSERPAA